MGKVYLLHFDRPYRHARHYLGFTAFADAKRRIRQHQAGKAARLTEVAVSCGIKLKVAWIRDGERYDERRLKNYHNAPKLCPICERERKRCR